MSRRDTSQTVDGSGSSKGRPVRHTVVSAVATKLGPFLLNERRIPAHAANGTATNRMKPRSSPIRIDSGLQCLPRSCDLELALVRRWMKDVYPRRWHHMFGIPLKYGMQKARKLCGHFVVHYCLPPVSGQVGRVTFNGNVVRRVSRNKIQVSPDDTEQTRRFLYFNHYFITY